MGVDPYLIAPTLILAMAQRLTLGLCPGAGEPVPIEGSLKMMIDKQFSDLPQKYKDEIDFTDKVYKAKATPDCPNGTRGRLSAIELYSMTDELEKVILTNPTEAEIMKVVRAQGMLTMREDAILKTMHQMIPFSEVSML